MPLTIEAPTDAQLAYIAALCTQHEMPLPDAVASKVEASRACRAMLANLEDAEYAYAVTKAGEDYFERAYGLRYAR